MYAVGLHCGDGTGSCYEAFRWTATDGLVGIGGGFASDAYGLSADGSVVGYSGSDTRGAAFRWTRETGLVPIGNLGGEPSAEYATGVSATARSSSASRVVLEWGCRLPPGHVYMDWSASVICRAETFSALPTRFPATAQSSLVSRSRPAAARPSAGPPPAACKAWPYAARQYRSRTRRRPMVLSSSVGTGTAGRFIGRNP